MAKTVAATGAWRIVIVKRSDAHSLRGSTQALDRRAHAGVDQSKPTPRTRLRTLRNNCRSLRPPRHDPHHAQTTDQAKPLLMNRIFPDGLLDAILGAAAGRLAYRLRLAFCASGSPDGRRSDPRCALAGAGYSAGRRCRARSTMPPPASRPASPVAASGPPARRGRPGRNDCTWSETTINRLADRRLGLGIPRRGHGGAAGPHDRIPSFAFQAVSFMDFRLGRAPDQNRFPVLAGVDPVGVSDALCLRLASPPESGMWMTRGDMRQIIATGPIRERM